MSQLSRLPQIWNPDSLLSYCQCPVHRKGDHHVILLVLLDRFASSDFLLGFPCPSLLVVECLQRLARVGQVLSVSFLYCQAVPFLGPLSRESRLFLGLFWGLLLLVVLVCRLFQCLVWNNWEVKRKCRDSLSCCSISPKIPRQSAFFFPNLSILK